MCLECFDVQRLLYSVSICSFSVVLQCFPIGRVMLFPGPVARKKTHNADPNFRAWPTVVGVGQADFMVTRMGVLIGCANDSFDGGVANFYHCTHCTSSCNNRL